jgi:hypothetical protein
MIGNKSIVQSVCVVSPRCIPPVLAGFTVRPPLVFRLGKNFDVACQHRSDLFLVPIWTGLSLLGHVKASERQHVGNAPYSGSIFIFDARLLVDR